MYASFFCSLQSVFVHVNVTFERCCYLDLGKKIQYNTIILCIRITRVSISSSLQVSAKETYKKHGSSSNTGASYPWCIVAISHKLIINSSRSSKKTKNIFLLEVDNITGT